MSAYKLINLIIEELKNNMSCDGTIFENANIIKGSFLKIQEMVEEFKVGMREKIDSTRSQD